MRDQHQRGSRFERRGAAIGGITTIKLVQARIAEMLAERRPQGLERVDGEHLAHPADAAGTEAQGKADRRGDRRFHVAGFKGVPDRFGFGAKGVPAARFGGPGKGGDGVAAADRIGPEIKARSILPGVARQPVAGHQRQMIGHVGPGFGKDRFEDPARREHRRAGIDSDPAAIDGTQLAARRCHALDNRHRHAARRQQRGSAQTTDAGPDDDHALAVNIARQSQIPSPKSSCSAKHTPIPFP